jgi:hypothetical protein
MALTHSQHSKCSTRRDMNEAILKCFEILSEDAQRQLLNTVRQISAAGVRPQELRPVDRR